MAKRKRQRAGLFKRGGRFHLWWEPENDGGRRYRKLDLSYEQEAKARAVRDRVRERLEAGAPVNLVPATISSYRDEWVASRRRRGVRGAKDDEARLRRHVEPEFGHLVLEAARPRDAKRIADHIMSLGLAPRTVRNVWGALHRLFEDAVLDEIIAANPMKLPPRYLPAIADKDPEWRATAVFTLDEIELLTTDVQVPADRRILYAAEAMAALRRGEAAALRWRHIHRDRQPLWRIVVSRSWDSKRKVEKSTKTGVPRWVPVHPALQALPRALVVRRVGQASAAAADRGRSRLPDAHRNPSRQQRHAEGHGA